MSSLLEAFGILFESNADDVKKGAKDAKESVDDLEDALTDAGEESGSIENSFSDIFKSVKNIKKEIIGLIGIGGILANAIITAKDVDQLGKFTETLGLSIEKVSTWEQAVIRSGGTAKGFRGSLVSLTDQLTDFALTGGGQAIEVLSRLGISAVHSSGKLKTAFEILPELADSFSKLSENESTSFGRKLGLDQATILLLQRGREELEKSIEANRELGVVTRQDAQLAADFNDAWADTRQLFKQVSIAINNFLLPALIGVLNVINDTIGFLLEHQEVAVGFFVTVGGAILSFLIPALKGATLAAIKFLIAMAPFIAIAAAVAAAAILVGLAFEDLMVFFRGGDSMIGRFIKKFPILSQLIKALISPITSLLGLLYKIGAALLKMPDDFDGALQDIKSAFSDFFTDRANDWEDLFLKIKDAFIDPLAEELHQAITKWIDDTKERILDFLKSIVGIGSFFGDDEISSRKKLAMGDISAGQDAVSSASKNPLASQSLNSISNRQQVNSSRNLSIGRVNVDARGGNAEEISQNIASAMNMQMEKVMANFDDGVR